MSAKVKNVFKDYIGDGVYADYDGSSVVLTTERIGDPVIGESGGRIETIVLEPQVLKSLDRYRERVSGLIGQKL